MSRVNMEKMIRNYFSHYNFDIRKRKNSRKVTAFTNQKCAPDVLKDMAYIILDWNINEKNEWTISEKLLSHNTSL